jgi:hypothetical protein
MSFLQEIQGLLRRRLLQLATLAGVLIWAGAYSFSLKYSVLDLDIWWHLKVGDWILQQHAVPHSGILSRSAVTLPWVAYSWGYEILLSLSYRILGLLGIGIFGTILTIAVAVVVFWMLRRLSGRFWFSMAMGIVACSPVLFTLMPRPVFFTMMLFCITLTLILEANRSGRVELLYWLPLIFAVWANLHIQFVYGLLLVGIFVGVNVAQRIYARFLTYPEYLLPPTLPADRLLGILAACVVATCIGPYSFHLYQVVFQYSKAKLAYSTIIELQAINFRFTAHYVQLLLTAAGFFAVGWQKKLDPFKLALLTVCSVVAFRTMRDSWFICLPAAAMIADFPAPSEDRGQKQSALECAGVAVAVCLGLILFARNTGFTERGLGQAVSNRFPVDAVNFLRANPVPGPLYNDLGWGGFLIWYMPDYPVAVDGRNDLYGDVLDERFIKSERGDSTYTVDPYLNESGVVLLRRDLLLVERLKRDPRFKLIYEDGLAAVFAR